LAAEQQGDLFGLLTFSDKVQKFVRAKNGKTHYAALSRFDLRAAAANRHAGLRPSFVPSFDCACVGARWWFS